MKTHPILLVSALCVSSSLAASTIQVGISTNSVILKDFNNNPLSAGTSADGDGTVVQLGYYTMATTLNPFAGNWVPMTGPGTSYPTTIGDSGNNPNGSIKLGVLFTAGSLGFTAPADGTPLSLRFYDSTSIATSTYFNAVSETTGAFNWVTPSDPKSTANLSFLTSGVVWQDGPSSSFRTTIAVPEPSSVALIALLGTGMLAVRRRPN